MKQFLLKQNLLTIPDKLSLCNYKVFSVFNAVFTFVINWNCLLWLEKLYVIQQSNNILYFQLELPTYPRKKLPEKTDRYDLRKNHDAKTHLRKTTNILVINIAQNFNSANLWVYFFSLNSLNKHKNILFQIIHKWKIFIRHETYSKLFVTIYYWILSLILCKICLSA